LVQQWQMLDPAHSLLRSCPSGNAGCWQMRDALRSLQTPAPSALVLADTGASALLAPAPPALVLPDVPTPGKRIFKLQFHLSLIRLVPALLLARCTRVYGRKEGARFLNNWLPCLRTLSQPPALAGSMCKPSGSNWLRLALAWSSIHAPVHA
jgi:hypothetical protein